MFELNKYHYGSVVYGVNSEFSDIDYIIITYNNVNPVQEVRAEPKNYGSVEHPIWVDVTFYGIEYFQHLIDEYEISALECLFLPDQFKLEENHKFNFSLDLPKLRKSFSTKASNSWCKAKKKMVVEGDPKSVYIGKKSLWHSFRILDFGIQIAKHGKIIDYKETNHLWNDIVLSDMTWEEYNSKYKKVHNKLSSEFRKLAPK